jgi:quinol monooxygenase YgiN
MTSVNTSNSGFVITAFWETREGEEAVIAGLLRDFLPKAQKEPWVKQFQIHQNAARPREFLFYEVFADEAGFADHQQTEHFKAIIQAQALPRLARRERNQFRFI